MKKKVLHTGGGGGEIPKMRCVEGQSDFLIPTRREDYFNTNEESRVECMFKKVS